MKALVTGDAGFVGRHFTAFLKEKGWDVWGMDTANHPDEDVIDYFRKEKEDQYDLIVHCAYEVGGRSHIDGKNMALAHNVLADAMMFDFAVQGGAKAVLYFSSSAAYPTEFQTRNHHALLTEAMISPCDLRTPDSNYGWAKLTGERLAQAASDQGVRVHIVRPFSGYSGDQSTQYPFPSIVKRASERDLTVWGPPGQTRDWIHISDVVNGSFAVYLDDERRPVNLCTGIGTEMGKLAQLIHRAATGNTGPFDLPITYLEDKPTGVFSRVGDPTRMNEHYTAKVSLEEGVLEALGKTSGKTT